MSRFTTGLIIGGVVGAIGLTYAFSDKRARRRVARDSRNIMKHASGVIENIAEKF
ncbi:MAG: hypothetical protein LBK41_00675 [Clostridiales bacterium]|jgi:hypothetical protein|nr:hypothetical protein [Clostridiales bacterium]